MRASRSAGDGGLSRLTMRLLHAWLRDVVARLVSGAALPETRTGHRGVVGQSLPLHGLQAHHSGRLPYVGLPRARAMEPGGCAVDNARGNARIDSSQLTRFLAA